METTQPANVEDLKIGSLVDLASCPFLKNHPSADMQYAEVAHVGREGNGCVVIGYEGIDHVGYAAGTVLTIRTPRDVPDPEIQVRLIGKPDEWTTWLISQNLTDRWGEINTHDYDNKPLAALEFSEGYLNHLREQMWDEATFIVRKDGKYGILFEVEYISKESEGAHATDYDHPLKPHAEMIQIINNETLKKLVPKFPGVEFAIPHEDNICNDRPALWAYVADGLLNAEQREALGLAMLNL